MTIFHRLGRPPMTAYFWAFIAFLFAPLVALVVFAFNQSPTPTLPITSFSTRWFHLAFADTELTGALVAEHRDRSGHRALRHRAGHHGLDRD